MNKYLYLRLLRPVEHTIFCVQDGQKTFYHPQFEKKLPFSSGQQVKRSILEALLDVLEEPFSPVTLTHVLKVTGNKKSLGDGEPLSSTDPQYADQLVGGWMYAPKKDNQKKGKSSDDDDQEGESDTGRNYRRRSPLSISAFRPLHPLLATTTHEALTFDRSMTPGDHKVIVRDEKGNSLMVEDDFGRLVPGPELQAFLDEDNKNLKLRTFMPAGKVGPRVTGLFVVDVAIDMSRLFRVSLDPYDPELKPELIETLQANGWEKQAYTLLCPQERRENIIEALANALVYWRITSNQARNYSPQDTIALALGQNANHVGLSIRAELSESANDDRIGAKPIIQPIEGVDLFISPASRAYIAGLPDTGTDAMDQAVVAIKQKLSAYNYAME